MGFVAPFTTFFQCLDYQIIIVNFVPDVSRRIVVEFFLEIHILDDAGQPRHKHNRFPQKQLTGRPILGLLGCPAQRLELGVDQHLVADEALALGHLATKLSHLDVGPALELALLALLLGGGLLLGWLRGGRAPLLRLEVVQHLFPTRQPDIVGGEELEPGGAAAVGVGGGDRPDPPAGGQRVLVPLERT